MPLTLSLSAYTDTVNGTLDDWHGPLVALTKYSANNYDFTMNLVTLPDRLYTSSKDFFNDGSVFNACIYATALGMVDFCISQYTISAERAAVVDWMILDQEEMWLITQIQGVVQVTDWFTLVSKMGKAFDIISQPFETGTWLFLIFFVVPVLGIMFIIHEYGQPGSSYQVGETEEEEGDDGTTEVTYREISIWEHLGTGLYNSFLSVLQGGYEDTVVSTGGFVHLIGVAFFLLTIIAVCKYLTVACCDWNAVVSNSLIDTTIPHPVLCLMFPLYWQTLQTWQPFSQIERNREMWILSLKHCRTNIAFVLTARRCRW